MATISPAWTENVSVRSAATLASSGTATHDIDLDTLGADRSDVQIDIIVGSSSGVTVEIFGSPDSGTTDDTTPLMSYIVSANDRRTLTLTGAYRQIKLTNNDGSNATGNITIIHAWRQWSSI